MDSLFSLLWNPRSRWLEYAPGRGTLALRRLWNIVRDYPHTAVIAAVRVAQHYGMFELERLERMVLRNLGDDNFFNFNDEQPDDS